MDKEAEVAEILLQLPQLIRESEQSKNSRSRFAWGVKKRRSPPVSSKAESPSLPTPPPSSIAAAAAVIAPCEPEKPKALSPSTPLLYSPSESDDKSKVSRRKLSVLERKRLESLQTIDMLMENKNLLLEQIENAKRLYEEQKELNLKLKSLMMNRSVIVGSNSNSNQQTHLIQSTLSSNPSTNPIQFQHQNRLITDQNNQTAHNHNSQSSSSLVSYIVNDNVGPLGIPDLNVSLEASFELETEQIQQQNQQIHHQHHHLQQQYPAMEIKALAAAQARQRRLKICRSKNTNVASNKPHRLPVYYR